MLFNYEFFGSHFERLSHSYKYTYYNKRFNNLTNNRVASVFCIRTVGMKHVQCSVNYERDRIWNICMIFISSFKSQLELSLACLSFFRYFVSFRFTPLQHSACRNTSMFFFFLCFYCCTYWKRVKSFVRWQPIIIYGLFVDFIQWKLSISLFILYIRFNVIFWSYVIRLGAVLVLHCCILCIYNL